MKGKVGYDKRMRRHFVSWYHGGKTHKIWHYNGWKLQTLEMAEQLLAVMRGDEQRGVFRIEKYLQSKSEVSPLIDSWLKNVVSRRSPATQSVYKSIMNTHVKPFFDNLRIGLSEIDYGLLMELNAGLTISETSKKMLFRILKSFLQYAQKTNRIDRIPVFPGRDDFLSESKTIQWLPEERQIRIIEAIDHIHQPVFWWLKYHMRRPAEACALMKQDFDGKVFVIRRTFSNLRLHETTKHKSVSYVPCVEAFKPIFEEIKRRDGYMSSPYIFINPQARNSGKHYTVESLRERWKKACQAVGENIQFYSGTKHSSASQLINEYGMNKYDVQLALDCSSNTVNSYAKAEVSARKAILDRAFAQAKRRAQ